MENLDIYDDFGRVVKKGYKCPFCQTVFHVTTPSTWTPVDEEYKVCTCHTCGADVFKEVHGMYAEKDGMKVVVE